jgi:hypothetical protein
MADSKKRTKQTVINPEKFGVSFSLKQCRDFKIDQTDALEFLIQAVGLRRFRLMSYWNEHEKSQGVYDFESLDEQVSQIEAVGGVITFCLGVRQPRWPESHWPNWALELPEQQRYQALYKFIEVVVKRYQHKSCIISWQLENEALNRSFGRYGDFNRKRLRDEYKLVANLDPSRPIIMSTSNTWGLPLRRPRPKLFGFTFYQVQYEKGAYSHTKMPAWWWSFRAKIIRFVTWRRSFIHELQAEPWGPKAIWEMSTEEQDRSMSPEQLSTNIKLAKKTNLHPIDLWGGEWWYWRHLQGDDSIWQTAIENLQIG